jgi:hypothetical protein
MGVGHLHGDMTMLQYLTDYKHIGDRPVHRIRLCGRRSHDIEFNTRTNEIRLRLQPGPRSVVGDQGIDPDHIIILARDLLKEMDRHLPCEQNKEAIKHLEKAIAMMDERRLDRIERNTEGKELP